MAVLKSKKEKATGIKSAELPNPATVAPAAAKKEAIKKKVESIMLNLFGKTLEGSV